MPANQKGYADQQVAGTPGRNYLKNTLAAEATHRQRPRMGRRVSRFNVKVLNEYMDAVYGILPLHFEGWRQG